MKPKVVLDEKDKLVVLFENEEPSFLNLVKSELLKQDEVKYASVVKEHPEINNVTFTIVTTNANPKKCLEKALDEIEKEIKEIEKLIK
ncbi:MAG: RpoL/Rpb11 RNA polymerase subunit family protein [Candidatus Micrarchaeia archaeon]|jgi:DNA-directed RNA polymerase subunit L